MNVQNRTPKKQARPKARAQTQARPRPSSQKKSGSSKGAPKTAAFARAVGSSLQPFLPGPLKALPLGELAGWAGNKIGTFLGLGEYQIQQNSIIGEGNDPPAMHNQDDLIRVRHREYIGDVFSSNTVGDFKVQDFPIQPGLDTTFQWLAPIALQYQEWIPLGIIFEFKSNTGFTSAAPSPATGTVIMATDYDSFDQHPFTDKVSMENVVHSTTAKTTESFLHPVECAPKRNVLDRMFVRGQAIPGTQPPQFYDLGTFCIASIGCPTANQNLGELWCTYEIGLSKATMKNSGSDAVQSDQFDLTTTAGGTFANAIADLNNSLGGQITSPTRYAFPPGLARGTYAICWVSRGAASIYNPLNFLPNAACALQPMDAIGSPLTQTPGTAIVPPVTTACSVMAYLKILSAGAFFDITALGGYPNGGASYLLVTQIDAQIAP